MMTSVQHACSPLRAERIASIDVFRGLTMLLMLFVNDIGDIDLGHIQNAPWWLKHMPNDVDGMTVADVILPCFLFIVGLAIPIALERRVAIGDSLTKLSWHIVIRAMALIFIGLCMVNSCHGCRLDEAAMGMSGAWWRIGMFSGVVMFWNRYPTSQGAKRWLFAVMRIFAAVLLVYLLAIYRSVDGDTSAWLQPRWWGIIGLIGWAYFVSAFVWLACRNNGAALMGVFALLIAQNIGVRSGMLSWWGSIIDATHGWFPGPGIASDASMVIAGMAVATLFRPASSASTPRSRIVWTWIFGLGFTAAGLLLQPLWGIHKSGGTPSWILCSLGIACAAYAFLYWLIDVKRIVGWTAFLAPAGSNTLLMYMLPYIFYSMLSILGIDYLQTHFQEGWPGVARAAVIAMCLVVVTGVMTRCGIRLKV